jgi:hypothetical protein
MFTSLAFFLTIVHRYAEDYGIYANKIEKKSLFSSTFPDDRRKRPAKEGANSAALKALLIYMRKDSILYIGHTWCAELENKGAAKAIKGRQRTKRGIL